MKNILRGQALADEYAKKHPLAEMNPRKVWASYAGGGWIRVCGYSLEPHPLLKDRYPHGWSLGYTVRVGEAQRELRNNFRRLRGVYAKALRREMT